MAGAISTGIRTGVIAGLALLCSASAVSGKQQAPDPDTTAQLVFHKSYDRGTTIGRGTFQVYFQLPEGTCKGKKRKATFGALSGSEKEVPYPAGEKVILWALTQSLTNAYRSRCQNSFSFVPEAGHVYDVSLVSAVDLYCVAEVIDRSTGGEPSDLAADPSLDCSY